MAGPAAPPPSGSEAPRPYFEMEDEPEIEFFQPDEGDNEILRPPSPEEEEEEAGEEVDDRYFQLLL